MKNIFLLSLFLIPTGVLAQEKFVIRSERLVLPQDEVTSSVSKIDEDVLLYNDPLENLELFTPGFNVNQNGTFAASTSVQLRGTARGFSQTYFDGLSLKDASDIDQSFQKQLLPSSFVGGGEVMRGIQSGLYGSDAVGGVINLEASDGHNQLTAKVGSYDYFALAGNVQLKKSKLLIDYSKAEGPSAYNHNKKAYAEKDPYHSLAGYIAHTENVLGHDFFIKALFIQQEQEIDGGFPFGDKVDNDLSSQAYRILGVGLKKSRPGALQYKLQVQHTNVKREVLDTAYQGDSQFVQAEGSYLFNRHISAVAFSDFTHDEVDIEGEFNKKSVDNGAIGIGLHEKIGATFFSQSLRLDHHSRFGDETTYRVGIGHNFSKFLTLRSSYATGFKAPTLYQLYTVYGGNQNLRPTKAKGFDISARFKFLQTELELAFFSTRLESQIDYDLNRSAYFNVAKSEIQGAEFSLQQRIDRDFTFILNATRLWTENLVTGAKLLTRPELTLSTVLSYQVSEAHKVSLQGFYKGERRDLVGTMPAYHTFSLSAEHQLTSELAAFWKIRNILGRDYEDVRDYGTYERSFILGVKRAI